MEFNKEMIFREKTVVNCYIKEKAINFCNWLHSIGETWHSGYSYFKGNDWGVYKENTCYYPKDGTMASIEYFKERGYTILKYEDVLIEEKELKMNKTKKVIIGKKWINGWYDLFYELREEKFRAEHPELLEENGADEADYSIAFDAECDKYFHASEYAKLEIEFDEKLNIVGGRVVPVKEY